MLRLLKCISIILRFSIFHPIGAVFAAAICVCIGALQSCINVHRKWKEIHIQSANIQLLDSLEPLRFIIKKLVISAASIQCVTMELIIIIERGGEGGGQFLV